MKNISNLKIVKAPSRLKYWFLQLSFWKKIIIIFTLNTLVLLVLTDTIMLILFGKVGTDVYSVVSSERAQFDLLSNNQVASSVSKMILTKLDLYANIVAQSLNAYIYFDPQPYLYTSKETTAPKPNFPRLTSDFQTPEYSEPSIYYYSSNSTFTDVAFIDEIASKLIQNSQEKAHIKRINLYVQNMYNPTNLTIRTLPGTKDFTFPSLQMLADRIKGVTPGYYSFSEKYLDQLSLTTRSELMAIRSLVVNKQTIALIEVELYPNLITHAIEQIYYFPSAYVMLVKTLSNGSRTILSSGLQPALEVYADKLLAVGPQSLTVNGEAYVGATIGMAGSYPIGYPMTISNSDSDPFKCVLMVKASEIDRPSIQIQEFLSKEQSTLKGIVVAWSFVILLSTVGLATVVGNYVFSNLKVLSTKMKEYLGEPGKFHLIIIELKELEIKGIMKKLTDNLIGIIEKIEVRKREKKDRISQNYHPLSIGEPKFQERQQLNDMEILNQIKEQVRAKTEALRKEAEAKEAEKAKTEKVF